MGGIINEVKALNISGEIITNSFIAGSVLFNNSMKVIKGNSITIETI